ncbi:FeS assembly SUF system protein [alpha proteobacterium AAP81b]|nr:FeS assembly SUF system protein [alpha proteobacterium AAP81b]
MNDQPRKFEIEEVAEAREVPRAPPPRALAEVDGDVEGRHPDYLEGFLKPPAVVGNPAEAPGGDTYEAVIAALRDIFDPEIPVNIYDMGLIYGVEITGGHANVTMTLTTPHCPVAETMPAEVEMRVSSVPGIATADINLVWDPPWDPGKMSDEAKLEMGML